MNSTLRIGEALKRMDDEYRYANAVAMDAVLSADYRLGYMHKAMITMSRLGDEIGNMIADIEEEISSVKELNAEDRRELNIAKTALEKLAAEFCRAKGFNEKQHTGDVMKKVLDEAQKAVSR